MRLHASKLRHYQARVDEAFVNNRVIVYDSDEEFGSLPTVDTSNQTSTQIDPTKLNRFSAEQNQQFVALLDEFGDVFTDKPGLCQAGMHEINVTADINPNDCEPTRFLKF